MRRCGEDGMYEHFFGLKERPFNLTPDPRFLYLSEKHKEAFAHLKYAIDNRTGFVMVTGEVGTGKTTICRSLLNQLDADTELAFVFNPMLSPKELLAAINADFGLPSRGDTIKELIDELNAYLLERNALGKNCVLVIDEAQNLKPEVLEQVRLLSNLETETQKLLQIVLIGQPELIENLHLPELRQLNQRITARYHLMPLNFRETREYIAYRLRVAGGRGKVRFTRAAIGRIQRFSGGTPRMINAVCDRALLVAYARGTQRMSPRIVRQAAKEIRGHRVRKTRHPKRAPVAAPIHPEVPAPAPSPVKAARPAKSQALIRVPLTVLTVLALTAIIWYTGVTLGYWPDYVREAWPARRPIIVANNSASDSRRTVASTPSSEPLQSGPASAHVMADSPVPEAESEREIHPEPELE
ncbi:MAG TPA: AAA family ATPase, partial [Candidatus Hydrogenedentes bacterium]|nr:AAA family ATPase [Candidatus Hydrogenedentota bacterium]